MLTSGNHIQYQSFLGDTGEVFIAIIIIIAIIILLPLLICCCLCGFGISMSIMPSRNTNIIPIRSVSRVQNYQIQTNLYNNPISMPLSNNQPFNIPYPLYTNQYEPVPSAPPLNE